MLRNDRRAIARVAPISLLLASLIAACGGGGGVAAPAASASAPAKPVEVSISYEANIATYAPIFFVAAHPELCTKYGVQPTVQYQAGALSRDSLLAGSTNMALQGGGSFVVSAQTAPGRVQLVAATGPLPVVTWVGPGINTMAELKGKTVASTSSGSVGDLALRLILRDNGLTVGKDVTMLYAGDVASMIALARTNQIAAFGYIPPLPAPAVTAGFHQVPEGTDVGRRLSILGVVANSDFLSKNKAAGRGFLQCYADAIDFGLKNPTEATAIMAKNLQMDAPTADTAYQLNKSSWTLTTYDAKNVTLQIDALKYAGLGKTDSTVDPTKYVDVELVKGINRGAP
jgi:NitT/TauT family transport system substrate-binding protein